MNRAKASIKISAITLSLALISACSSDGNGESSDDASSSRFPVAGSEAGAYTLNSSGGNGGVSSGNKGGSGGTLNVTLNDGMEGRIDLLNTGKVDASFSMPSMNADTGTSGETIAADTTINVASTEPAIGTLYTVSTDNKLYKSDADGTLGEDDEVVSGLTINAGITLTLALNDSGTTANLNFLDDIMNNGTVTTAATGTQKGDLTLLAKNIFVSSGGSITTAGSDASVIDGGAISLTADRVISNAGNINSSGFTDTSTTSPVSGGNAGNQVIAAGGDIYNTGTLSAMGGTAATGTGNNGGTGGEFTLSAEYGNLNNSGTINTSGGNGDVSAGNAGNLNLWINQAGDLYNTGNLSSTGGDNANNSGGNSGYIFMRISGGSISTSGDLTTSGGSAGATGATAGKGGAISIQTRWGDFESMPGDILISGNMNTQGGTIANGGSGNGGNGGSISITGNNSATSPAPQYIGLWGYTSFTATGGDGDTGPGILDQSGGGFQVYADAVQVAATGNDIKFLDSASITNKINANLSGGNTTSTTATDKSGGNGGTVEFRINSTNIPIGTTPEDRLTITNSGDITTSSGNNFERTSSNKKSGPISMSASGGITNSGNLITTGGNDTGTATPGMANNGGPVTFTSSAGDINNSGAITTNGGNGELSGGAGANITLKGSSVYNTANFSTNGGNANATVSGSTGGAAGDVMITTQTISRVFDSGAHSHNGGTGQTAGANSEVHTFGRH